MSDLIGDAEDLGHVEDMDVIDKLAPVAGLNVVDVGCGDGHVARALAKRGAKALGVEPDPVQAGKNRISEPVPGLSFAEAPGQALPVGDKSMDGVFFSFSLHHVPPEHMDGALAEAMRVLKPETGFLYVLEPMLTGSLEAVYKPFHDETIMRGLAYDALKRFAAPGFATNHEYRYSESVRYESFAAFVDHVAGSTYSGILREEVDTAEVRAVFERGRIEGGYCFIQNVRLNLYRGLSPGGEGRA